MNKLSSNKNVDKGPSKFILNILGGTNKTLLHKSISINCWI